MMKIQGNGPNHETSAATRTEQARSERHGRTARQGAQGGDRVEISSDVQLVSQAVKAAGDAPAIRQDAVAQARQKLMSGKIGNDSMKLADRLIDHLLQR
jgi:flagellar biosynthesis anti-sigma factor FlgM